MAHGGKVNFRQNYKPEPDTGMEGPYTRTHANLADMVLIWLSGFAIGLTVGLIATGN